MFTSFGLGHELGWRAYVISRTRENKNLPQQNLADIYDFLATMEPDSFDQGLKKATSQYYLSNGKGGVWLR